MAAAVAASDISAILALGTDLTSRGLAIDAVIAGQLTPSFLGNLSVTGAAAWLGAMTTTRYEAMLAGSSNIADEIQFNTVWALYNQPSSRSVRAAELTWEKLYTARILPGGDNTVTWPGGTTTENGNSWEFRSLYMPVGPAPATMITLMDGIRALPRGHVNLANIAFVHQSVQQYKQTAPTAGSWTNHSAPVPLGTSYYLGNCKSIVICCDNAGQMTNNFPLAPDVAVGGKAGGPALTWFMNHVRHEIGHAVGEKVMSGMAESGNAFAQAYGGWTAASTNDVTSGAYFASAAKKTIQLGTDAHEVEAADVKAWTAGLVETGAEVSGNAITLLTGSIPDKLAAITAQYSEPLVHYVNTVTSNGSNLNCKDSAYQFPGVTTPNEVIFWASRFNPAGWVKVSKTAHDACVGLMGWYSCSSPIEMFAEMYTQKYSGGGLPPAVNGKTPETFFTALEASDDTQFKVSGEAEGPLPMNPPAPAAPGQVL